MFERRARTRNKSGGGRESVLEAECTVQKSAKQRFPRGGGTKVGANNVLKANAAWHDCEIKAVKRETSVCNREQIREHVKTNNGNRMYSPWAILG